MATRRIASRRARQGVALAIFVIFLFVLIALAALVIDGGMARSVQQQMRTAADMAAVDGLRFASLSPEKLSDPAWLAAKGVDWNDVTSYAGPLPPTTLDPFSPAADWQTWLLRAQEIVPRLAARRLLRLYLESSATTVDDYTTSFGAEMNPGDAAGVAPYRPTDSDGAIGVELNLPDELGVQEPSGDLVTAGGASESVASLDIQLRRQGEIPLPGQRSSGPPLPALFRFSTSTTAPGSAAAWPAGVSASGRAILSPVRSVGPPSASGAMIARLGAAPFFLLQSQLAATTIPATVLADQGHASSGTTAVGDPLTVVSNALPAAGEGYVPCVNDVGAPTVIGFAWIAWRLEGTDYRLRRAGRIAPENASAIVRGAGDHGQPIDLGSATLTAPVRSAGEP